MTEKVDRIYGNFYSLEHIRYIIQNITYIISDINYQLNIDNYNTLEKQSVLLNKQIFSVGKCVRIFIKYQLTNINFGQIYNIRDDLLDMTDRLNEMSVYIKNRNVISCLKEFDIGIEKLEEHKFYILNLLKIIYDVEDSVYGINSSEPF